MKSGAGLFAFANIGLLMVHAFALQLLLGTLAGLGFGCVVTLPRVAARFGAIGVFAGIATLALASGVFFLGFERGIRSDQLRLAAWRIAGARGLLLGSAAQLDASGRLGTLGGGTERLGCGIGAWIGRVLAEHAGYPVTGLLGFVGCAMALAVGFPSLFRALDKSAAQPVRVAA